MSVAAGRFADLAFAAAFAEHRTVTVERVTGLVGPAGPVIGVDASPAMIWFCRRTVRAPNVCFVEGDAYSPWSYPGAPVDHVGATRAWQNFVLDKQQLAEQLRRIMWAGGSASTSV